MITNRTLAITLTTLALFPLKLLAVRDIPEILNLEDGNQKFSTQFSTFSEPDQSTGTFSTSIPVPMPPGKGGMGGGLALSYSSDGAPGIAGYGWSIPMECIDRHGPLTSVGQYQGGTNPELMMIAPRNIPTYTSADQFYLGGQRLVKCTSGMGSCAVGDTTTYRTEFDSFARITAPTASAGWKVETESGMIKHYDAIWTNSGGVPYRYCLSSVSNLAESGSSHLEVKYSYEDMPALSPYVTASVQAPRLKAIDYAPGVHADLIYETRNDYRYSFEFGHQSRMDYRLQSIIVSIDGSLFSSVDLTYLDESGADPQLANRDNNLSFLHRVVLCGTSCSGDPDVYVFDYDVGHNGQNGWTTTGAPAGQIVQTGFTLNDRGVRALDINGDGRTDLVKAYDGSTPGILYGSNNGGFVSTVPNEYRVEASSIPSFETQETGMAGSGRVGHSYVDLGVRFAHLTKNKVPDIIQTFFYGRADAPLTQTRTKRIFVFNSKTRQYENVTTKRLDENGDGDTNDPGDRLMFDIANVPDFIWAFNECQNCDNDDQAYNYIMYQDFGYRFVDLNGDGLDDLIRAQSTRAGGLTKAAWINNGRGFTRDDRYNLPGSVSFTTIDWHEDLPYSARNIERGVMFVDVNADGLVDLVQSEKFVGTMSGSSPGPKPKDQLGASLLDRLLPGTSAYAQSGTCAGPAGAWINVWLNTGVPGVNFWSYASVFSNALRCVLQPSGEYNGVFFRIDAKPLSGSGGGYYNIQDNGWRFSDVNDDGLPDLLKSAEYQSGPTSLNPTSAVVYLHNGNGWDSTPSPAFLWPRKVSMSNNYGSFSRNKGFEDGGHVDIDLNLSISLGQLTDVNSDGRSDIIDRNGYYVLRGGQASLNRMVKITNPLGGVQFLSYDYANDVENNPGVPMVKVVVDEICVAKGFGGAETDMSSCINDSDDGVVTMLSYKGGQYDTRRSQFMGYRYVRASKGLHTDPIDSTKLRHLTAESWLGTNWCNSGTPLVVATSAIASLNGLPNEACEHRLRTSDGTSIGVTASFEPNLNVENGTERWETVGTAADPDACWGQTEVLSTAEAELQFTGASNNCDVLAIHKNDPNFIIANPSTIQTTRVFDPGRPSQPPMVKKDVSVYNVNIATHDVNSPHPTSVCTYSHEHLGAANGSCTGIFDTKKAFTYTSGHSAWVLDRVCVEDTYGIGGLTEFHREITDYADGSMSGGPVWGGNACAFDGQSNNVLMLPLGVSSGSGRNVGSPTEDHYTPGSLKLTNVRYDEIGNKVFQEAFEKYLYGKSLITRTEYDANTGLPMKSCIDDDNGVKNPPCSGVVSVTSNMTYDNLMRPIEMEDANGNHAYMEYDAQHRMWEKSVRNSGKLVGVVQYRQFNKGDPEKQRLDAIHYFKIGTASTGPGTLFSKSYVDGLGRTYKTISGSNTAGDYAFSKVEFDKFGQTSRSWAPSGSSSFTGAMEAWSTSDVFGRVVATFENGVQTSRSGSELVGTASAVFADGYTQIFNDTTNPNQPNPWDLKWNRSDSLGRTRVSGEMNPKSPFADTSCVVVDTAHNPARAIDVNAHKRCLLVEYVYDEGDARGRGFMTKVKLPMVDPNGEDSDPNNNILQPEMELFYDDGGRKTAMIDYDMSNCQNKADCAWEYEYDLLDRLVTQTDANESVTNFVFDDLGRKEWRINCKKPIDETTGMPKVNDPSFTESAVWYDYTPAFPGAPVDRLSREVHFITEHLLQSGNARSFVKGLCQANGRRNPPELSPARPTVAMIGEAQKIVTYGYHPTGMVSSTVNRVHLRDPRTENPAVTSEPKEFLQELVDNQVVQNFKYNIQDVAGPMRSVQIIPQYRDAGGTLRTLPAPQADTITTTYDSMGRVLNTESLAFGRPIVYNRAYSPEGQLMSKDWAWIGHPSTALFTVGYQYYGKSDGILQNRLKAIQYDAPDAFVGRDYSITNYTYDTVGNIQGYDVDYKQIGNATDPAPGAIIPFGISKKFRYDRLSQLVSYLYSDKGTGCIYAGNETNPDINDEVFKYDRLGNRTFVGEMKFGDPFNPPNPATCFKLTASTGEDSSGSGTNTLESTDSATAKSNDSGATSSYPTSHMDLGTVIAKGCGSVNSEGEERGLLWLALITLTFVAVRRRRRAKA